MPKSKQLITISRENDTCTIEKKIRQTFIIEIEIAYNLKKK